MANILYSLIRKKNTDELHLFESTKNLDGSCNVKNNSICKAMTLDERIENKFSCQPEDYSRVECARIGRKVCGICVSHLYETY